MLFPVEVENLFGRVSLVAFGTVDGRGSPNVVPVFWKKILGGGTILLIDNFMGASMNNVQENSLVCVSFWDSETEEAYKIKGTAKYLVEGKVYDEGKKILQAKDPERVPKGVVEITPTELYTIKPGLEAGKLLKKL